MKLEDSPSIFFCFWNVHNWTSDIFTSNETIAPKTNMSTKTDNARYLLIPNNTIHETIKKNIL